MASAVGYINTGGGAVSSATTPPPGAWNRPTHKPTCCTAVYNGNSCCMCVPSTATCYIIEMWGQGGGGGGGCCCGVGVYGGQGGSYGWVTCTTSGVNHTLCACTCQCFCSTCTICSGTPGQFSRVYNCQGTGGISGQWCVCGGVQGLWCCNPTYPACYGKQDSNTWLFWKNNAAALATASTSSASATVLPNCCNSTTGIPIDSSAYTQSAAAGSAPALLDKIWGNLCVCSAFSSPYVWSGACGFSDGAATSSPFGCINAQNGIANAQCGGGMGVGGAAYAGGDQAWHKCSFDCASCWVQCGNFPGGGGMSTWSGSAWANPGWGASGLILMSWC